MRLYLIVDPLSVLMSDLFGAPLEVIVTDDILTALLALSSDFLVFRV